jgi:anti-anti-sigma regulatory factor
MKVSGRLTQATSVEFLTTAGCQGSGAVILDLSGVDHMDSAGVGSVVIFAACQTPEGLGIVAPDHVRQLFKIAGVDELLPCFPSEAAAQLKLKVVAA